MSESLTVLFGSLLQSLRTAAGLAQEEPSEAARVSYRSVSDLERGVSRHLRRTLPGYWPIASVCPGTTGPSSKLPHGAPPAAGNMTPRPLPGGIAAAIRALPRDIALFTGRERRSSRSGGCIGCWRGRHR